MYFDSASNVLRHDIRVILISFEQNHCPFTAKFNFNCTYNMVEYEAYVMRLQATVEKIVKRLEVYGDFALVIC